MSRGMIIRLKPGEIYRNRNGSDYRCIASSETEAWLERVSDGWRLTAHHVIIYSDGAIEWAYSTGGCWPA